MNKRELGADFEDIAIKYLIKKGYKIIDKNYQCKFGEIDIIAKDNDYLCFIEVKYRSNTNMGYPAEAITPRKINKISKTARYYLMSKNYSNNIPCRFDVIIILGKEIELIKNAFEEWSSYRF